MRTELLYLALVAGLAGCPSSRPDDTDPDTDTDTELDSDTDPDTDTDTIGAFCGDGNVDSDEQCDDGDANGPDPASCSEDCTFNGFVTCDVIADGVVIFDTSLVQPDGTFHLAGEFSTSTNLDSSCAPDSAQDVAVTFALPADGSYLLSTANTQTSVPVALSLRTDCDERTELSCTTDNASEVDRAQALIVDGSMGDTYVALIHSLSATEGGSWHLSLSPATSLGDLGDSCDEDNLCGEGLCYDGLCVENSAPVITDFSVQQVAFSEYRLSVDGSDMNADVVGLRVVAFTDIIGDVWGDGPGEYTIDLESEVSPDGTSFNAVATTSIAFSDTNLGDIQTLSLAAVDAAGNVSDTVTVLYPDPVSNELQNYVGDACDMCIDCDGNDNGYPRYCNPNAHADPADPEAPTIPALMCVYDDASNTTASCVDRSENVAPVPTGGTMRWEGPQAILDFSGTDTAHSRGIANRIEAVFSDNSRAALDDVYTAVDWYRGSFTGSVPFDTEAVDRAVDHLEVWMEDNASVRAETEDPYFVDWVEPVPPTAVTYGEACDPRGWTSVCDEPSVCTPTLSGLYACADSEAPVLNSASGILIPGFFPQVIYTIDAYDANADWYALMSESPTSLPVALTTEFFSVDPFGLVRLNTEVTHVYGDWLRKVYVQDADGNESDSLIVATVPTDLEAGDTCNTGTCSFRGCTAPESYCDVNGGMTCSNRDELAGPVRVCETNEAPVLDSINVTRTSNTTYQVAIAGSDANGDASGLVFFEHSDTGTRRVNAVPAVTEPINGATSFTTTVNVTLDSATDPFSDIQIDVQLKDYGMATSETLNASVPPLALVGETCSDDEAVDRCQAGSVCEDGTCVAHEPILTGASVAWSDDGLDAVITVTGTDDVTGTDHELVALVVMYGGEVIEQSLSRSNVDWEDTAFSIDIRVNDLGQRDLDDVSSVDVAISDIGGFGDDGTFDIDTLRGLDGSCDATVIEANDDDSTDNICHIGLTCDTGTCVVDPVAPCLDIGITPATGEQTVTVNTAGGTRTHNIADYGTCGSDDSTHDFTGREQVIAWTSTQDGILLVDAEDDPVDGTEPHAFLVARYDECLTDQAIAACDNRVDGANSLRFPVFNGDVVYIVVDGDSFPSGGPVNVSFAYE